MEHIDRIKMIFVNQMYYIKQFLYYEQVIITVLSQISMSKYRMSILNHF